MQVVGVDGYPRGWVAVALRDGRFESADVFPEIGAVSAAFPDAVCLGVDIPIGPGPREADRLAREFVGPRRASVFPAPSVALLRAQTFAETTGVSRQSFALFPKIREVADSDDERIVEVHPEVSFRALAGRPLSSKTTWNGFMERRRLLTAAGIVVPDELDEAGLPLVDVLDAAVAAWSAGRHATGDAESLDNTIWY